jgi:hypothetical protein
MRISVPSDPPAGPGAPQTLVTNVVEVEPLPPASEPQAGSGIALEYVDRSGLSDRPEQRAVGPVRLSRGSRNGPTTYGPEPTFPAAYFAAERAPAAAKTREAQPGRDPGRTPLVSRLWRRLRKVAGGRDDAPAGADTDLALARGESRDVPKRSEGVERIATDRVDEASQR